MRAIYFNEHGGPEVLRFGDLPTPEPKLGEALIRVRAVALNHLDIWVRRGWRGLSLQMPHISGSDVVGEVVKVNANSSWIPGQRVMINPGIVSRPDEWTERGEDSVSPNYRILGEHSAGGLAEFVCVPIQNVFTAPDGLNDEEVAASLLVGTTCWRMLFKQGKLHAGETVLVVGSGGGVNSLAISMAVSAGAQVITLCGNAEKMKKAKALGAHEVIDYNKNPNWPSEVLRMTKGLGADLVVDNVGADTFNKSLRAVARAGRIVTVGNTSGYNIRFDNRILFSKQVSLIGSTMGSKQDFLAAINFMLQQKIKPVIDVVSDLGSGIDLLQKLENGQHFGKIVLKP